jgi:membrane-associated protease RseP (regulator of RpoE activity)
MTRRERELKEALTQLKLRVAQQEAQMNKDRVQLQAYVMADATALSTPGRGEAPLSAPLSAPRPTTDGPSLSLQQISGSAPADDAHVCRGSQARAGIGVQLIMVSSGDVCVLAVREGSSAEEAGIAKGDRVVSVDGTPIAGRDYMQVVHSICWRV